MDPPTSYFSKLKAVLFSPCEFFESISGEERITPAYVFILLTLLLYGAVFGLLFALIGGIFFGILSAFLGPALGISGALLIFVFILLLIGLLFFFGSLFSFLSAGLLHLFVKLFSGQGSYAKTYNVTAYAMGVMLPGIALSLIPFVGPFLMSLWLIALIIIGLSTLHQISKLRAFGAWICMIIIPSLLVMLIISTITQKDEPTNMPNIQMNNIKVSVGDTSESKKECFLSKDCKEGFHCMNNACINNNLFINFQDCVNDECTQECTNCKKKKYVCLLSSETFKNNKCVECFMDLQCSSGYTCKKYLCVQE